MILVVKTHLMEKTKNPLSAQGRTQKNPDFNFKKELERLPFEVKYRGHSTYS